LFTGNPVMWPSHAPEFQRSISTAELELRLAWVIDVITADASASVVVAGSPMRFHPLSSAVVCGPAWPSTRTFADVPTFTK
jgi:hypothetical protein